VVFFEDLGSVDPVDPVDPVLFGFIVEELLTFFIS
jgi:hypothetical protein